MHLTRFMKSGFTFLLGSGLICLGLALAQPVAAQGTAFTYQGRLDQSGDPANGRYDLTFGLYDSSSNGNQYGATVTNLATVVSNGMFTVPLDFGANFPGTARWLQISVRTNGNGTFTLLTPRQQITPTPYAIAAGQLTGPLPADQLSGTYPGMVNFSNPSNSFAGNGGGLTNINAATLGGLTASAFWQTAGNSGTSPANGSFIGTVDAQALDFRVGNARALRLEPGPIPNVIGGASNNVASGSGGVIGGGTNNTVGGTAATVPGGANNVAQGDTSFAAGQRAKALNNGAFVWADGQNSDFASTSNNQFSVRAGGGVRIITTNAVNTNGVGMTVDGIPVLVGSGVGVLAWQTVSGATKQAEQHYGYVLTNSQQVTITLPASGNVGDVFRVSGAGAGGWKIAQNAGQSILAGNFTLVTTNIVGWTASTAPTANWWRLASSADGNILVAAIYGGVLYRSANSGDSWSPCSGAPSGNWISIAASADGRKMVAAISGGKIYYSQDYGANWSPSTAPTANWTALASSADGNRLLAAVYNGPLYTSANGGTSWTNQTGITGPWQAVASSGDGTILTAGYHNGPIYSSLDSGASWNPNSLNQDWLSLATAADGKLLYGASSGALPGQIFKSDDTAANWPATSAPLTNWTCIAASADGAKLVASVKNGPVYLSANSGTTWRPSTAPATYYWSAVATSADGNKLAATVYGGGIYISRITPQSTTTVGTAGYLLGGQGTAVELQYLGNGQFIPISHEGDIFAY